MKKFIFSILILASIRLSAETVTFAVIGDAGHPTNDTRRVQASIKKSNINNLILPGDNLYDLSLTYKEVWGPWVNDGFEFPVVAIGNHSLGYTQEMEYFGMPAEYFLKVVDGVNFIVLNSDNQDNISDQVSFLYNTLSKVSENTQTFLVYHHPPATVSYRHSWQERKEFHDQTRWVLKKFSKKIDAIFVGHDHQASIFTYGDIPVIVSGAIFEHFPSRDARNYIDGMNVETVWRFESGFYWVRLDVNKEKNWSWINFVNVDRDRVECSIRISKKYGLQRRSNCLR